LIAIKFSTQKQIIFKEESMTGKQLRLTECSGTSYEIGRHYGEAAREGIFKGLDLLLAWLGSAPYQARVDREAVLSAAAKYLPNVRKHYPEGIDKVRGMAEGAGISFEECFAVCCYTELVVAYPYLAPMCTSFAVSGPATRDGKTIIGQNVDWHPETPLDLVRVRKDDGGEQLSLTFFCTPSITLNSKGVANSANLTISPMGPVTGHVPFAFFLAAAMREPSADKALEAIKDRARGVGYFHFADRTGRMVGIESVYDSCSVLQPKDGVLVHANHYETEAYAGTDVARMYMPDSFVRASRLRALIREHYGSLTPELMMELLADHQGHPNSICRHVDPEIPPALSSMSAASLIMVPAEGRMYVASGPPCENGYAEYRVRVEV
jgi:isopenicillin-N N-acyltransferase like protein